MQNIRKFYLTYNTSNNNNFFGAYVYIITNKCLVKKGMKSEFKVPEIINL